MNRAEFRAYRDVSIQRFKKILAAHEPGYCDEQGLPAYTNPNFLMRWLTWKRVDVVLSAIEKSLPIEAVLDFGCGYGVFLPYLMQHAANTYAYDLIIQETKMMGDSYDWKNIHYLPDMAEVTVNSHSFDLILAIEVMEHVENLDKTVEMFANILAADGHLLVAGPTENFLYKIGRKLAGYSGEYHVRNIFDIYQAMKKYFVVRKVATILPIFPFYEVYDCTLQPQADA